MQNIDTENKNGVVVLHLKGRIDATNSGQVHEKITSEIKKGCDKMLVNFSEVNYISSAGLRVVIYASKSLAKNAGSFSICALNDNIKKIFEISGLVELFSIHDDLETGLNALKGGQS